MGILRLWDCFFEGDIPRWSAQKLAQMRFALGTAGNFKARCSDKLHTHYGILQRKDGFGNARLKMSKELKDDIFQMVQQDALKKSAELKVDISKVTDSRLLDINDIEVW